MSKTIRVVKMKRGLMKKFIAAKVVVLATIFCSVFVGGGCSMWWFYQPEIPCKKENKALHILGK